MTFPYPPLVWPDYVELDSMRVTGRQSRRLLSRAIKITRDRMRRLDGPVLDYIEERGTSLAETRRILMSERNSRSARTPEGREQRRRRAAGLWSLPGFREKWLAGVAANREKYLAGLRAHWESPEARAKMKAQSIAMWSDPERKKAILRKRALTTLERLA